MAGFSRSKVVLGPWPKARHHNASALLHMPSRFINGRGGTGRGCCRYSQVTGSALLLSAMCGRDERRSQKHQWHPPPHTNIYIHTVPPVSTACMLCTGPLALRGSVGKQSHMTQQLSTQQLAPAPPRRVHTVLDKSASPGCEAVK
jgi:hypothetical protein